MVARVAVALLCLALVCGAGAPCVRGEETPGSPPGGPPGTITGVVVEKATGQPIVDAGVEIVGTNRTTRTDLDGKYSIRTPPGTYEVRVFAAGMQSMRLQGVLVKPGAVSTADAALASSGAGGLVVEVVAPAKKATEAAQLAQRKASAVVSDTISAETMKKSAGSSASDVVKRAPAVTVKDDKFVVVRGLAERYSQALLDGSKLPSPDPQRRVVPLDLFPATFLQSLAVIKTFTPNLPGDFSGGLIDLNLREFPDEFEASLNTSIGGNTQATFRDFKTYDGGSLDYLGLGTRFRALPNGTPGADLGDFGPRQRFAYGRRFRNIWAIDEIDAPTNSGLGFSVGNSLGPFGFQLGGTYSNEYKRARDIVSRQFLNAGTVDDPDVQIRDDFRRNFSSYINKIGGILTAAYKLDDNNKIALRSLIQRNAVDNVQTANGSSFNIPDLNQFQSVVRYTAEELDYGQLSGEHKFPWLSANWRSAWARTTQDEPDTRFVTRVGKAGEVGQFNNDSLGGTRVFNTLRENLTDNALDIIVPYRLPLPFEGALSSLPGKFQFGPAYTYRDRHFAQRRFEYVVDQGFFNLTLPTETLLAPQNIGANGFNFEETTLPQDKFSATQEIIAGYGMFDMFLWPDKVRLVAGVRPQYSYIVLRTFNQITNKPDKPIKNDFDPLPGVNLTYSPRSDMNIRAGWSKTVSYPEFRELSPAPYLAPRGEEQIIGNPDLVETKITSWDLRWEWFFSPLELVSLSFFYKNLQDPIERTVIAQSSNLAFSFFNADSATIIGMEFESRKDFGFLAGPLSGLGSFASKLKNFSILTNFTYASSNTIVPRGKLQVQTNTEREFQGLAPYIINLTFDYTDPTLGTARLMYNRVGSTLFAVGAYGVPDRFEEPRNQLDAVLIAPLQAYIGLPVTAQLTVENILNDRVLLKQGDATQLRFTTGVKFTMGLTYAFN